MATFCRLLIDIPAACIRQQALTNLAVEAAGVGFLAGWAMALTAAAGSGLGNAA
jgi:hypothetical protein